VTERPKRIVLVGMMGSGKSTVGRALATALGWPILDNDALVRDATGHTGSEIFRTSGEAALHEAEREALVAALRHPAPAVVTAAASVVDDSRLRAMLRHAGQVVWLRATVETLVDRIDAGAGAARRSDAGDVAWLTDRAAERAPRYADVADTIVDVDGRTVGEVVAVIRDAAPD
jgi:shikimate kinase